MSWFSKSLFILMLLSSSIFGVSMNNMMLTWSFMEFNMLFFIPLISMEGGRNSHMVGMKYFLVQSLGSIFLLAAIFFMVIINKNIFFELLMIMSLLWKIGLPPFHFWLLSIMMELDWVSFFILSTWQKILPFFMVSKIWFGMGDIFIFFMLIICVISSYQQLSLKKLMVFSTIFTSAWIISSMVYMKNIWLMLLLMYSIMLFFLISFIYHNNLLSKDDSNINVISASDKIFMFFTLISMAGIPPFLGFFMKVSVLLVLMMYNKILLSLILVMSSIFMVYMYVMIMLNSLMFMSSSTKTYYNKKAYYYSFYIMVLLSGPLMLCMF